MQETPRARALWGGVGWGATDKLPGLHKVPSLRWHSIPEERKGTRGRSSAAKISQRSASSCSFATNLKPETESADKRLMARMVSPEEGSLFAD